MLSWKHGPIIAGAVVVGLAGAVILASGKPSRNASYQAAVDASDDVYEMPPANTAGTNTAPVNTTPVNVAPSAPVNQPAPAPTAPPASDAAALVSHLRQQGIATTRDAGAEQANLTKISSSAAEFGVTTTMVVQTAASNFVTYGSSTATVRLGAGERLAVVRDLLDTLGSTVQADDAKLLRAAEEISSGEKPSVRNLTKERAQSGTALSAFRKLTGRDRPNFEDPKDDLAWNTLLYRVRFPRDLVKEREGITKFKATFQRSPKTPSDWATVRAWAYALR